MVTTEWLPQDTYKFLEETMTEEDALRRLTSLCASAEYCEYDLCEKMRKWGVDYVDIDNIIAYLRREKYIDDERYCRAFINDKYRFAKWGKVKIGQALAQKRIEQSTYRPLLGEINREEYLEILTELLRSKRKSIHAESDYERNGKLARFAMSRGFEYEDIKRCMPDLEIEEFQ
jgi:regulatory protein